MTEDQTGERVADQEDGEDQSAAVEALVASVMKVERRYAHALRGAVSERLEGIRDAIEATVGAST